MRPVFYKGKKDGEIRYLTPLNIETNKAKKYCRFKNDIYALGIILYTMVLRCPPYTVPTLDDKWFKNIITKQSVRLF